MKKVDCPRMTFISLTDRKHIQAMRTVPNMHQASSGPYYRNVYVAWNNELQRVELTTPMLPWESTTGKVYAQFI